MFIRRVSDHLPKAPEYQPKNDVALAAFFSHRQGE
jgi:hypothetical protein